MTEESSCSQGHPSSLTYIPVKTTGVYKKEWRIWRESVLRSGLRFLALYAPALNNGQSYALHFQN